ncbi:helix-turn-helix domain-containing protein [Nonomuraea jabiensis]|uniref:nSTAND1 domain-containing NTPase n=1 Tax=Nonomuraea jabiensis TaxID=882448 RepID=UPI003D7389CA
MDHGTDPDGAPVLAPTAGAMLRALRRRRGLSLRQLAELTHYTKGYLSKVETDDKALTSSVAHRCDTALETGGQLAALVTRLSSACPYRGLSSYGPGDGRWFFGRDSAVAALLSRLADAGDGADRPLIMTGPSGSGKSSLLCAGLLPAVRRGALPAPGSSAWPAAVLTPGERPTEHLLGTLGATTGETVQLLAQVLKNDPRHLAAQVRKSLNGPAHPSAEPRRVVLVVDQLEEIFTLCRDPGDRTTFLAALQALAAADGPHATAALVVLAVRADFYGHCLSDPGLVAALSQSHLPLGPMTQAELLQAITGPAHAAGLTLEDGLTDLLLRDLGRHTAHDEHEHGALPLLSHTLMATWQQRRGNTLTVQGYRLTGGIAGAVASTAERAYHGLQPGRRELARRVLLQMVCVGEDNADTRRPLQVSQLPAEHFPPQATSEVIESFAAARLLTLDAGHVQLAHETILRAWPRMREWIHNDRAGLRTHRRLAEAAHAWEREHRDAALLYRGTRLRATQEWAQARPAAPTTLEREFLNASQAAETREQNTAVRRARRRRHLLALLTTLLVLTAAAGAFAVHQRDLALSQRAQAASLRLAAQSESLAGDDLPTAARLAAAAWQLAPTPEARAAMMSLLSMPGRAVLPGEVMALTMSPDGRLLAAADQDGTIRLWHTDIHRPTDDLLSGHHPSVLSVAFSPDGRTLASGGRDGSIRLWDVATRRQIGTPLTAGSRVLKVVFRPDGHSLASIDATGTLQVWSLTSRTPMDSIRTTDHDTGNEVAFSRDGRILGGYTSGKVQLWDTMTLRSLGLVATGAGTNGGISALAFSYDGRTLATALSTLEHNGTVRLWDVVTQRPISAVLPGHVFGAQAVAFSPDGNVLATSDHSRIRLWDLTTHQQIGTALRGSEGNVPCLAFSPDGAALWSGGAGDNTLRRWDVTARRLIGAPLRERTVVTAVAFHPDGRLLATAGGDRTVRLWDLTTHRPPALLTGHTDAVYTVAFSPDGRLLAGSGKGGSIRLWDVATRRPAGTPLPGHHALVHQVAFSPDGRLLASTGDDRTIRLWDVATRRQVGTLLTGRATSFYGLAFSPSGRLLASADGHDLTVRLWDVATHRQIGDPLRGHKDAVWSVAFSPDGRLLASAGEDRTIRLWDVATHQRVGDPLTGHQAQITALAFSPDGTQLASAGSHDLTARIWDVATRRQIGDPLTGHADAVYEIAFHPNGKELVTGSGDDTIRRWDIDQPTNLVAALCDMAGRSFTPDEWARYMPEVRPRETCPQQP